MRLTLFAFAAALAASVAPAAACGPALCPLSAVADDAYPPGQALQLSPAVADAVAARQGKGLSLAGFYNDPALALAAPVYPAPPPRYGFVPPPEPASFEPPPVFVDPGFEPGYHGRRHHGPHVIMSPYGRHGDHRRWAERERHHRAY